MFSGIIEYTEKPTKIENGQDSLTITLPVPEGWNVKLGDSVSLDGVCCTIQKLDAHEMSFFLMHETLSKTTFGSISKDYRINVELPLTLSSFIGGHLVSGHIDTTARVIKATMDGESKILTFELGKNFTRYIIYKGSITVNGVSLTVTTVNDSEFSVSLIPYTLENTNLGSLNSGDSVNIELDLIAKYLEKLSLPVVST